MKTALALATIPLTLLLGCTSASPTPEQVRHDTARATQTIAQDAKAAALGIRDGLKQDNAKQGSNGLADDTSGLTDLNHASRSDLEKLPGITRPLADRIIAGRPYRSTGELRSRHLVSAEEYDRISAEITVR